MGVHVGIMQYRSAPVMFGFEACSNSCNPATNMPLAAVVSKINQNSPRVAF